MLGELVVLLRRAVTPVDRVGLRELRYLGYPILESLVCRWRFDFEFVQGSINSCS
jgi:hypothetical protein